METSFFPWREEFEVGHEGLDAEHRRLVDIINEINAAERAGRTPLQMKIMVDRLRRLAVEHFQHENRVLNRINSGQIPSTKERRAFLRAMVDASIPEHAQSHKRSLAQLDTIILEFHSASNFVEQNLSHGLKAWFTDHMTNFDARLKAVFKTMSNRADQG